MNWLRGVVVETAAYVVSFSFCKFGAKYSSSCEFSGCKTVN